MQFYVIIEWRAIVILVTLLILLNITILNKCANPNSGGLRFHLLDVYIRLRAGEYIYRVNDLTEIPHPYDQFRRVPT